MFATPAFVLNARHDILGANALGRALFSLMYADSVGPNSARFTFLDPRAIEFFREWDKVANDVVALLRAEVGRDPYDRQLSDLIGELSTRSDEFRVRWAAHDVRVHTTGAKLLHHPIVGDLDLAFDTFPLGADPDQTLLTYTAEPGCGHTTPCTSSPAGQPPTTMVNRRHRRVTPTRLNRRRSSRRTDR